MMMRKCPVDAHIMCTKSEMPTYCMDTVYADSSVVTLTDRTFDSLLFGSSSDKPWVVEFYAPVTNMPLCVCFFRMCRPNQRICML